MSSLCGDLDRLFPLWPSGLSSGGYRAVFGNASFQPAIDQPLEYPRAEQLATVLYHSSSPECGPYAGLKPRPRPTALPFSFAAKYSHSIRKFVTRMLAGPPRLAIEVGSFLGAGALRTWGPLVRSGGGLLLCVDTWQGDLIMRLATKLVPLTRGFPRIADEFLQNVVDHNMSSVIFPLPMPSLLGARVLATTAWQVDLIYVDSAHERGETLVEIHMWYQLLRPGGLLMGDDYRDFPAVRHDVDTFVSCHGLKLFEFHDIRATNTCAARPDRSHLIQCSPLVDTLAWRRPYPGSSTSTSPLL